MISRPIGFQPIPETAELAFRGKLFDVWQWDQELFNGQVVRFEKLRRPDTVLVLPVTSSGNVLFAREQQPGTSVMLRTIGGRIEPGETPIDAAARELIEESGLSAQEFRLWDAWHPINKIDWVVYLFVAVNLTKVDVNADSGERISLESVSVQELLERNSALIFDDMEFNLKRFEAMSTDARLDAARSLFE